MFTFMSLILTALAVLAIILVVGLGWTDHLSRRQRLALTFVAAGLLWAGPARALRLDAGPGDVMFLVGVLGMILDAHGSAMWRRADLKDGRADNVVRVGSIEIRGDLLVRRKPTMPTA
ncbi:hypothetical protein [Caulobacter sp. 1776]|uniref:hypothetical protein n=1 Tax=Caulobacter sp. 1776 TaxID=3156420 RepID=UPI0033965A02